MGMRQIFKLFHHHRFRLLILLFLVLAVVLGVLVVPIESVHGQANIRHVGDGIWWSVTTMTGVGFGDVYPVTAMGRVIGMVLEVCGVIVFGLIAGQIAVALFRIQDDFNWKRLFERMDGIEQRLDRMEKKQEFVVKDKAVSD